MIQKLLQKLGKKSSPQSFYVKREKQFSEDFGEKIYFSLKIDGLKINLLKNHIEYSYIGDTEKTKFYIFYGEMRDPKWIQYADVTGSSNKPSAPFLKIEGRRCSSITIQLSKTKAQPFLDKLHELYFNYLKRLYSSKEEP